MLNAAITFFVIALIAALGRALGGGRGAIP